MATTATYTDRIYKQRVDTLRELLMELPEFCFRYFTAIEPTTMLLTRIGYARDLKLFFYYLTEFVEPFDHLDGPGAFTLKELDRVRPVHLERYLEFLNDYEKDEVWRQNHENSKSRKLAALRSLFRYFYKQELLTRNVAELVDFPTIHQKEIIRLETDEVARLLDEVESGQQLTDHQQRYHAYTRSRDLAMISVFLGTGIRISECVGLNVSDLDFNNDSFVVTRKGGNRQIIYFWDEVEAPLLAYLDERAKRMKPLPGHEDALFLSLQNKRMSVRAVQEMVKKYSRLITPLKKITPHKLRSTYGTSLYQETGDIYLVADVLGHSDVNTTRKHYAAMQEDRRRMAARAVHLRKDD